MRKPLILTTFLCLTLLSCKKETSFTSPQIEDYTGKYSVSGNVETTPGTGGQAFSMTTGYDAASRSTCELLLNYQSIQGYRLASSALREDLRRRQFLPLFFGGTASASQPINQWAVAELDSIFKVGKRLTFGKNFGQVVIEFADETIVPVGGTYSTEGISNAGNTVLIEQVENVVEKFSGTNDASPWAKTVTFSFSCNMRLNVAGGIYEVIALKNCRATMLFKP
jgi:hypothetical protein